MKNFMLFVLGVLLIKLLIISFLILWMARVRGYTFQDVKQKIKFRWSCIKSRINRSSNTTYIYPASGE